MPTYVQSETYPFARRSNYLRTDLPGVLIDHSSSFTNASLYAGSMSTIRNTNPNYKTQIAKRQDASTAYQNSGYDMKFKPAVFYGDEPNGIIKRSVSYLRWSGTIPLPFPTTDSSLQDLALTRLKRKLQRHIGSFESLVPIFEIKDLRTTVSSMAQLTRSLVGDLIDIKRTRGKSAYKYASKAFLTYGFGLRPMMQDVEDLCNAISTHMLRQDHVVRLAGSSVKKWITTYKDQNFTCNRLASASSTAQVLNTLSYRYIALVNLPLTSSNNYGAIQHLGLDFPSVLPALWEAAAFSWISDYFTNIGELLNDTFYSPPGNCVYVVLNRRYTADIDVTISHVPSIGVSSTINRNGYAKGDYFDFQRTPFGSTLPHVGLRMRSFDEISSHGVGKLLNLVSILGAGTNVPGGSNRLPRLSRGARYKIGDTILNAVKR